MLSIAPAPIIPTQGQSNLLQIVQNLSTQGVGSVANFPVPYVVHVTAGSHAPIVVNQRAGAPSKIDADASKTTGKGGNDIQVEVNTEMLPQPHLVLDITRLGSAPFVEDLQVLIAFPFTAFAGNPAPGVQPNIFMGYRTTAVGNQPGGHAPLHERIELNPPSFSAATARVFNMTYTTDGPDNPMTFLVGTFNGDATVGVLNAFGIATNVQTATGRVPPTITVGMDVNATPPPPPGSPPPPPNAPPPSAKFAIDWHTTQPTLTTLSYIESTNLAVSDLDFANTLTFDQMPTSESFGFEFTNNLVTLAHRSNAPVGSMTFKHETRGGLLFTARETDVPTEADASVSMNPVRDTAVVINNNASTMDVSIEAINRAGFAGTNALTGRNLGYIAIEADNVPDMTAGYIAGTPILDGLVDVNADGLINLNDNGSIGRVPVIIGRLDVNHDGTINSSDAGPVFGFNVIGGAVDVNGNGAIDAADDGKFSGIMSVAATNPGESVPRFQIIADDDAHHDPVTGALVGLQLPPSFHDVPRHHLFSLVEDGTHATAVARILNTREAVFDFNATSLSNAYHLVTSAAAPLQAYIKLSEGSAVLPGPNDDIEITCDVDVVPAGEVKLFFAPPDNVGYQVVPPTGIASIHLFGHVGLTNFDVTLGNLPPLFSVHLDPGGTFSLLAEDGFGGPARVGALGLRLSQPAVAIVGGSIDLNNDGVANAADDGTFLSYTVIDGRLDTNGDGVVDATDTGLALGFNVIGGRVDVSGNGTIGAEDNRSADVLTPGLPGGDALFDRPLRDLRVRVDDVPSMNVVFGNVLALPFNGATGTNRPVAGDVVWDTASNATAVVRIDSPNSSRGSLQLTQLRGTLTNGAVIQLLDPLGFANGGTPFTLGDTVVGATSHATGVIRRLDPIADRGTMYLSNRAGVFTPGETLLVNGIARAKAGGATGAAPAWSASIGGDPINSGTIVHADTAADDAFVGGLQIAASTDVDIAPLPAATPTSPHYLRLHSPQPPAAGRLEAGVFGIDEVELLAGTGGIEVHFDGNTQRPANLLVERDVSPSVPEATKLAVDLDQVPQVLDFSSHSASLINYTASNAIDSVHLSGFTGLATFDVAVDDLPRVLAISFDAGGAVKLRAADGAGGAATIGQVTLRQWETQVAFVNGLVDINADGTVDGADDGTLLFATVTDGHVEGLDGGVLLGFDVIGGGVDVNGDGVVNGSDDLAREDASPGLKGTDTLLGRALRDVRLRVDDIPSLDGVWGAAASVPFEGGSIFGRPFAGNVLLDVDTGATGIVRKDVRSGLVGVVELEQVRGAGFAAGASIRRLDRLPFVDQLVPFAVGDVVEGAISGTTAIVRRVDQLGDTGTLFISDKTGFFANNEPLMVGHIVRAAAGAIVVATGWSATVTDEGPAGGMAAQFGSVADDVFLGGVQVAVSTQVELDSPLPPPTATGAHFLDLTDLSTSLSSEPVPGRLSLGFFGIDGVSVNTLGGIAAHFDAATARPAQFLLHTDFGDALVKDKALDLAVNVLDVPQQLDLATDLGARIDYSASDAVNSITVVGTIDSKDDGLLNFHIRNGSIDLNRDGAITTADSGLIGDLVVNTGRIDINGDGVANAADDGTVQGIDVINGALDLDEDGSIGFGDSQDANATEVRFGLVSLPDEFHLRAAPGAVTVIEGSLDLNADGTIDGDDAGKFGGIAVIGGKLDLNEDGVVDDADEGEFLNRPIHAGAVDLDGSGEAGLFDDGKWFGIDLQMSGPIPDLELLLRSQSDDVGILDGESRLMHVQAQNIPARWLVASFGKGMDLSTPNSNGFVFRTTDADGNPAPFGSISALIATTKDDDRLAELRKAFQQQSGGTEGAVLDGSTPARINYSAYLQDIDERYYDAGDAESVLDRLASLYSEGAVLDTADDHVLLRNDGAESLTDVLLHGFQVVQAQWSVIFNPISAALGTVIDGVIVNFKAPTAGAHPLFFGMANSDADANGSDDGFFASDPVIDGRLDTDSNGVIDNSDDGVFLGHLFIDGELDLNDDFVVDENDDGFIQGVRVIDGRLDVSEQLLTLTIENVPDHVFALMALQGQTISYDASANIGDVDVYSGTMTVAPENTQAFRLRLIDTPRFVHVTWDADLLHGGFNVDASRDFEARLLLQVPSADGTATRYVAGLHMEDIQLGYNIEPFTFDVAESFDFKVGIRIIDGRLDINDSGSVTNADDSEDVDGKRIINGRVDIDDDGDIDGDDDGLITLIQWDGLIPFLTIKTVIDGEIDQDGNGVVGGGDDYNNLILSIPTAWDLFRATAGIDNNAESPDIGADDSNVPISGFFGMYTLLSDAEHLHPAGALPGEQEYVPLISVALDEFKALDYTFAVTLDPFTPSVDLNFVSFPSVFPLGVDSQFELSPDAKVIFDFWLQDEFPFGPLTVDFPDDIDLGFSVFDFPDDFSIAAAFGPDYFNNSPLHLFPVTTISPVFENRGGVLTLTEINLHGFGDHEDPFA